MNVTLSSATIPTGFCAITNAQWQTLVSLLSGTVALTDGPLIMGPNEPTPDLWEFPWYRTNADGTPDRIYTRWSGVWVARHPLPPGSIMLSMLEAGSVPTFDGGEGISSTPVTTISGPMWLPLHHADHYPDSEAKVFIQPGTLPGGTALTVGDTGGEENHTLTVQEMPAHSHPIQWYREVNASVQGNYVESAQDASSTASFIQNPDSTGGGQAHNNMPPYFCIRAIIRTARLFYRL